jgi:hypothetical protein
MSAYEDRAELVQAIVERCRPALAGTGPEVQCTVIAVLTSTWLSGFDPDFRAEVRDAMDRVIEEFVAAIDAERAAGGQ